MFSYLGIYIVNVYYLHWSIIVFSICMYIGYQNKNDTRDDLQCRKYEKRSQIIDEDDEHYSLGEYSI